MSAQASRSEILKHRSNEGYEYMLDVKLRDKMPGSTLAQQAAERAGAMRIICHGGFAEGEA